MLYRPGQTSGGLKVEHLDQIVSNIAPLPFPVEAKLDKTGEGITLLQTCNWQGNSPADIAVDQQGKQLLGTFDEITVTDSRVVPNPAVQAIRAGQMGGSTGR
jgi:hypothetical protein